MRTQESVQAADLRWGAEIADEYSGGEALPIKVFSPTRLFSTHRNYFQCLELLAGSKEAQQTLQCASACGRDAVQSMDADADADLTQRYI